jgi:hypothetical protein
MSERTDKTIEIARSILKKLEVKILTNEPLSRNDLNWLIEANDSALTLIKSQETIIEQMKPYHAKLEFDLLIKSEEIRQISG